MTVPCTVCVQPALAAINRALLAGTKDNVVSRQWQLGPDAVRRHRLARHFPAPPGLVVKPTGAPTTGEEDDPATWVRNLRNEMIRLGAIARDRGDGRLAGELRQGDARGPHLFYHMRRKSVELASFPAGTYVAA